MSRMLQIAKKGRGTPRAAGGMSALVRVCLALAAVWAAYFIMTDPWPAEVATRIFADAPGGSLPSHLGNAFGQPQLAMLTNR